MERETIMNRANWAIRAASLLLAAAGVTSCGGGGPGLPPLQVLIFNFSPGFSAVKLNSPLEFTFSAPVDAFTVTPDTIRVVTNTTTTQEPNPGAPAIGQFVVSGNVVRFLPQIPQRADLQDAGFRIGFGYQITIPASPDVIEPVRTIEGKPNVVEFRENFFTLNQTILPAPSDITAEPNLASLSSFFVDEGIANGNDPCNRALLPVADRDSPQVIQTDPTEGETGFGTITGIEPGLGTAFVRLDPLTLRFSEPISPWRIRAQNISIRNENLLGETFDLFFFFRQDRSESILQITVFDANSAFDQASVPQGKYVLSLTQFTDLAGNPLVNSATCVADGKFNLSFSTVSSPAQPTDIKNSFQDDDVSGHTDVGGLGIGGNDVNLFRDHAAPFIGGIAIDHVAVPSPSQVTTSANPGNIALWSGREMRYNNGYDPADPSLQTVPDAVRLRGGATLAASAVLAPIAGRGTGRSSPSGSLDGSVPAAEVGKIDFQILGPGTATLFTGSLATGPILYHFNEFRLEETAGGRPLLTYRDDSVYPLVILVEDFANIWGDVIMDGRDGEFGFNGANDGTTLSRPPGGRGGLGGPGGGKGGDGGSANINTGVREDINGQTGGVSANVLGPLNDLSESLAGVGGMISGGGGHYDVTVTEPASGPMPVYEGGGGGGMGSDGGQGGDFAATTPGQSDQGVGGKSADGGDGIGPHLFYGGAGGGGGGADDDSSGLTAPDALPNSFDNGGGGGGGGGGAFSLSCAGNIVLGFVSDNGTPADTSDDIRFKAVIRACGGRGGSTYATVTGDPPSPSPDESGAIGRGEAGGGGAAGGISLISGSQLDLVLGEVIAFGKRGGNSAAFEGGGRGSSDEAGAGGGGLLYFADIDGFGIPEIPAQIGGGNNDFLVIPDSGQDLLAPLGTPDLSAEEQTDRDEMSGVTSIFFDVYGDDSREVLFGTSRVVTEFFDTLSSSVAYNFVRVVSNCDQFPAGAIRVFCDMANSAGGLPDLSTEDASGALALPGGFSFEVPLTVDETGAPTGVLQSEAKFLVPVGSPTLGKRFCRQRIVFDLAAIGTPATLLSSFAPGGTPPVPIAPGNTLGIIDTAPQGVPAVADLRVNFTP
jgi:hypothetical protein